MGRAEAWKGKWGLYVDGYHTYLGRSGSQVVRNRDKSFGPVDFTLHPQVRLDGVTLRLNVPGQISDVILIS
jgi:hypothetical protein